MTATLRTMQEMQLEIHIVSMVVFETLKPPQTTE